MSETCPECGSEVDESWSKPLKDENHVVYKCLSAANTDGSKFHQSQRCEIRALTAQLAAEKGLREAAEAWESSFITRAKETATTSCTDGVWWATCKNGGVYGPQATEREVLLEVAEMRHVFAEARAAGLASGIDDATKGE